MTVVVAAAAAPGSPFFLFATVVAAGTAAALVPVPLAAAGRRFFVLATLIALLFAALATAAGGLATSTLHLVFAGLLILFNVIVPPQGGVDVSRRREERQGAPHPGWTLLSRVVLAAAALAGGAALAAEAPHYASALAPSRAAGPWLAATLLSSALLLGGSLVAMVLGHWYLVLRGPSFAPLSRATGIVAGALVARAAVAAGSVFLQRELWGAKLEAGWMPFLVDPGVYVAARVVFGFLLPAVLAPLAWRCVRLRSNQSATGILYVNLAFVVIGEIIAEYFLISDGIVL